MVMLSFPHRQCCSGKELVDWLMKQNECMQSRSQAVGMWQVLVDEGILVHGKNFIYVLIMETFIQEASHRLGTTDACGMNPVIFWHFLIYSDNNVSGCTQEFPPSARVAWNLVTEPAAACFSQFFRRQVLSGWGTVLPEENTPIREQRLHQQMMRITRKRFIPIFHALILQSY